MRKILLCVLALVSSNNLYANYLNDMYVKIGAGILQARSNNFYATHELLVEGAIYPTLNKVSYDNRDVSINLGVGKNYEITNNFTISPELTYTAFNQNAIINPIISNPDYFYNSFRSEVAGDLISLNLKLSYKFHEKYNFYVAPGIGIAKIVTTNNSDSFSDEDEEPLNMHASQRQNKIIPQIAVGINYQPDAHWGINFDLVYMHIGDLKPIAFTDPDDLVSTTMYVRNLNIFGPELNFTYSFA